MFLDVNLDDAVPSVALNGTRLIDEWQDCRSSGTLVAFRIVAQPVPHPTAPRKLLLCGSGGAQNEIMSAFIENIYPLRVKQAGQHRSPHGPVRRLGEDRLVVADFDGQIFEVTALPEEPRFIEYGEPCARSPVSRPFLV